MFSALATSGAHQRKTRDCSCSPLVNLLVTDLLRHVLPFQHHRRDERGVRGDVAHGNRAGFFFCLRLLSGTTADSCNAQGFWSGCLEKQIQTIWSCTRGTIAGFTVPTFWFFSVRQIFAAARREADGDANAVVLKDQRAEAGTRNAKQRWRNKAGNVAEAQLELSAPAGGSVCGCWGSHGSRPFRAPLVAVATEASRFRGSKGSGSRRSSHDPKREEGS